LPAIQLILMIFMSPLIMIYLSLVKPMATKYQNRIEVINEYLVGMLAIFQTLFSEMEPNKEL